MGNFQRQHAIQLDKILAAPSDPDETLKSFIRQFYAKVPAADLERIDAKQAGALAASAYRFIHERPTREPQIRIFRPNKKEHGYESRYLIVELLNDDMPFLVDSLSAELTRHGFTIRETIHPILRPKRDKEGTLQTLAAPDDKNTRAESLIHFEISALPEGLSLEQLKSDLEWVLQHIRVTVEDWQAISAKVADNIAALQKSRLDKDEVAETEAFLRWLADRNFVFMGYAEYDFFDKNGKEKLSTVAGSKLGILKITDDIALRGQGDMAPDLKHFLQPTPMVEITKSTRRSPVHRPVLMDYIAAKRFDANGKVIGEVRYLGLFTSNVYYQSAGQIPLLRQKIKRALARADFDPASHDGKAIKAILEFLPRDEVFQMSDDDVFETSMGILALEARPGIRVFARRDTFERFISLMVFVPKEQFSTELRRQIQEIMEKAFNGSVSSFATQITEAPLARLHLTIKTSPGDIPAVDLRKIESEIAKRAYLWSEFLLDALMAHHDENKAGKLHRLYAGAFPQGYINRYDANSAVHDIGKIEDALARQDMGLELFHNKADGDAFLHLKIYNPNEEIALSDILPLLERAGFRAIEEQPFLINPQGVPGQVWIRDFKLQISGEVLPLDQVKTLLEEALLKVWRFEAENDGFNALVMKAALSWRQVTVVRAYAKYLRQIGFAYAQTTIEQAMLQHPQIAKNLVALFESRFDPNQKDREKKQKTLQAAIEEQLAQVTNAAFDRILRRYSEVILATLRTNYYQKDDDGAHKPVLSCKFDSTQVPELPLPKPFAEIFVYGTRVEGIHLRGGKVARGGLRWSDRHDDFRTEVLGLMKAQMVKNSVIVPVGSKGGFVVKRSPVSGGREAILEEGIACYKLYLHGLLDITDNIKGGKVVPPKQVVRHDGDDPYLVVAADKGTATFSDIANSVSAHYGFWLGDAFASGGSAGYDHKAMAITARGGWVSVTRHFREMGVDIEKQDFTATGIGDMAGDVFGNGMILSDRIKLFAAFNHMHIFIDPTPDGKASFAERKRLFNLPRSSWKDYDAKLISKGGGVFERSAKSIALSKEAQATLGVTKTNFTPDELIRVILMAPVDLLWNGGIGTYVKAEEETHDQVGDRTNNSVRINGKDLRCKIVGEGGNLGFTQKGRIEYARAGGRINTDAIDNSAGVDCSDHEVNIKIALNQEMAKEKLTLDKRNKFLRAMTEEVAQLVLKDNILQTQAITIAQHQGVRPIESQGRLMHMLERQGLLDRSIEFLPTEKQLAELKATRKGLTRPELAVLLAYSKMMLYKELLETTLPDEAYFAADLKRYFPKAMQEEFEGAILQHRLKREIIATVATNSLINRAGITFYSSIADDLGASPRDIVAAYTLARDAFGLRNLWKDIENASTTSIATQAEMYGLVSEFLEQVTVWLLRNLPMPLDINAAMKEITPGIAEIEKHAKNLHSDTTRKASEAMHAQLTSQGVPEKLAHKIAQLELMSSAFDIISVSHKTGLAIEAVGKVYFSLGARLRLGWLRLSAAKIASGSHWDRLAVQSMIGDLHDEQRRLSLAVIEGTRDVDAWVEAYQDDVKRFDTFIDDLKTSETLDAAKLMVALRHVRSL